MLRCQNVFGSRIATPPTTTITTFRNRNEMMSLPQLPTAAATGPGPSAPTPPPSSPMPQPPRHRAALFLEVIQTPPLLPVQFPRRRRSPPPLLPPLEAGAAVNKQPALRTTIVTMK
jgi:hypothetical protein